MKPIAFMSALLAASLLVVSCRRAESAEHFPQVQTLGNGIRVVSVHFPGSTNISIFTFLPMGLTSDKPDQAQWSHLIEHLVIRSTIPAQSAEANAETLPDHMHARHLLLTWPIPDDADKSSQSRCRSIHRGTFEDFSVGNVRAIHTHQAWKRAIRIPCFGNGIGSIRESS